MKKKRILVWTALMIFFVLTINANAISDKNLADIYYDQADEAYNTGDCMNASGLANRSLGLYTKINDDAGRLKTLELIGKISTCLRDKGDDYYNEALKECNKETEKGYRNCITWAEKAKGQYSLIPDQLGVSKCETQIQYAEKEIRLIMEKAADKLCDDAMKLYDGKDVFNAKVKAKEARGKYGEINHNEGIKRCDALLAAIKIYIEEITQEAEAKYRYATEHYQKAMESSRFDDYDTAMGYAKKAKKLFNQVRNTEGDAKSEDLITVINNAIMKLEDEFRREADSHYTEGLNELLFGKSEREGSKKKKHFNKAKSYVNKARSIYNQLYDWADSIKDSRLKTKKRDLYKGEIRECDEKLREIEVELGRIADWEKAEALYVDANSFFTKGECNKAKKLVDNATSLFKKISYYTGVSKCDELTKHVKDCLAILKSADKDYTKAVVYYKKADSKNATRYVTKARNKYESVKYEAGVRKCDSLKKKIGIRDEKKTEADKLLSEARTYYGEKRYRDSNKKAEEAKEIYEEIGYKEGISSANSRINKNNKQIKNIDTEARETMLITVGVILGAIVVTIAIWGVRKTQERRMDDSRMASERQREEEELRHRKEEVKKRERERIHELEIEREKLKAMVEGEKKRLETGEK